MSLLPDGVVDLARAVGEATLTESCTVHHRTDTPDNYGGYTTAETNSTVNCRVSIGDVALSVGEQTIGASVLSNLPLTVRLPHDTTIDPNDRITYQDRTLEVVAVLGPKTNEALRRVACRYLGQ